MTFDIPELKELHSEIAALRQEVAGLRALVKPRHTWWTLRQCAAAKRGYEVTHGKAGLVAFESFYSTLKVRHSLRPPGEPREVGGRQCWHIDVVLPWLQMPDDEL